MSTAPTPDTRAIYKVLQQLLGPPHPSFADLRLTHHFLTEDGADAQMAFYYWTAGANPSAPGANKQLAHFLLTLPDSPRNAHIHQVCRSLADYAATAEVGELPHLHAEARIIYLLCAALVYPGPSIQPIWDLFTEAGRVHPSLASTHPLFEHVLRRLAAPLPKEVQA